VLFQGKYIAKAKQVLWQGQPSVQKATQLRWQGKYLGKASAFAR
jgi:hypothetical protein